MPNCERNKLVCPHAQWADAEIERLVGILQYIIANDKDGTGFGPGEWSRFVERRVNQQRPEEK